MSCIFCRIVEKKAQANIIYEDESIVCFNDAAPQAPVHCLVIPRKHIADLFDLGEEDIPLIAHLMGKIPHIAGTLGLEKHGFRLVCNSREMAGQSVFHLHFHIMGGRSFRWPPG